MRQDPGSLLFSRSPSFRLRCDPSLSDPTRGFHQETSELWYARRYRLRSAFARPAKRRWKAQYGPWVRTRCARRKRTSCKRATRRGLSRPQFRWSTVSAPVLKYWPDIFWLAEETDLRSQSRHIDRKVSPQ